MAQIIFLGTAGAVADGEHENTYLAVTCAERVLLVDASGNTIARLRQAGIDPTRIDDIILTHFHPDHVSGVPILLMDMWLLGRREPVRLHGLSHALDRMEKMMELYEWWRWPNFFPVEYHRVEEAEGVLLLENPDLRVVSAPVKHLLPTLGLRFEFPHQAKTAAYSCDTEPDPAVVRLAQGADVLIHEAAGATLGHSSAEQAGVIASEAGAKALYLVHYHPKSVGGAPETLVAQAAGQFNGPVTLAQDLMRIALD
ncbi:MAG TPA: MBL fold metallo-hydrolase [Anaerolineaceae bacterium]